MKLCWGTEFHVLKITLKLFVVTTRDEAVGFISAISNSQTSSLCHGLIKSTSAVQPVVEIITSYADSLAWNVDPERSLGKTPLTATQKQRGKEYTRARLSCGKPFLKQALTDRLPPHVHGIQLRL